MFKAFFLNLFTAYYFVVFFYNIEAYPIYRLVLWMFCRNIGYFTHKHKKKTRHKNMQTIVYFYYIKAKSETETALFVSKF